MSKFSAALCRGLIEASLGEGASVTVEVRFPRLYAAASLKRENLEAIAMTIQAFSAALCRGLIEAWEVSPDISRDSGRFPRLYAAASLKPGLYRAQVPATQGFPRLYAAASLKLAEHGDRGEPVRRFSAALCRGLIEAGRSSLSRARTRWSFSAALCRGLIEASPSGPR